MTYVATRSSPLYKWPTARAEMRGRLSRAPFWDKIPPAWTRWPLPAPLSVAGARASKGRQGQKPIELDSGVNRVGHSSRLSQRQRIGARWESELSRRVVRSPPHRLRNVGLGCHRSRLRECREDRFSERGVRLGD